MDGHVVLSVPANDYKRRFNNKEQKNDCAGRISVSGIAARMYELHNLLSHTKFILAWLYLDPEHDYPAIWGNRIRRFYSWLHPLIVSGLSRQKYVTIEI